MKFQVSKGGSFTLKYILAFFACAPFLARENWKFASGTVLPFASLPLTGACTSRRMSNNCPAKKSVLGQISQVQSGNGTEMTNWSGGNTQPKVGHVPSLRKDCALHTEQQAARAVNGSRSLEVSMMSRSSVKHMVGN